jgi:beta-N-acetylhexosaminidase
MRAPIGLLLAAHGINVNCAPMLDVRQPDADQIMGDRAYGTEPMQVAAIGRAVLDGLSSAGVVGVVKHMPGHAAPPSTATRNCPAVGGLGSGAGQRPRTVRSAPRSANGNGRAHPVRSLGPRPPLQSVALSHRRRSSESGLAFRPADDDDIGMEALDGLGRSALSRALAAGCDLTLHCSGKFDEIGPLSPPMVGAMTAEAEGRLARRWPAPCSARPKGRTSRGVASATSCWRSPDRRGGHPFPRPRDISSSTSARGKAARPAARPRPTQKVDLQTSRS